MAGAEVTRYQRLVREIREEFPGFRLIPKAESGLQKLIYSPPCVLTLGQMRSYKGFMQRWYERQLEASS